MSDEMIKLGRDPNPCPLRKCGYSGKKILEEGVGEDGAEYAIDREASLVGSSGVGEGSRGLPSCSQGGAMDLSGQRGGDWQLRCDNVATTLKAERQEDLVVNRMDLGSPARPQVPVVPFTCQLGQVAQPLRATNKG